MTIWQQKKCQSQSFASFCMTILLFLGRDLVKARAWTIVHRSSSSAPESSSLLLDKLTSTSGGISTFLRSSANGDNEGKPRTGWNHNQPESWESPNGEGNSSFSSKADESKTEATSKASRTGWLHNKISRQELERENKERKGSDNSVPGTANKAQLRLQQAMKDQKKNHRIVEPPAFYACGNGRQVVVTEHRIAVPVYRYRGAEESYTTPNPRIDVAFAVVEEVKSESSRQFFKSLQQLTPSKRATKYVEYAGMSNADQMMVYLQGGPGFGSPTPSVGLGLSQESSWAGKALGSYYSRIVLMDQRGTGRSTPITKQSLERKFPDLFRLDDSGKDWTNVDELATSSPQDYDAFRKALEEATKYVAQFRADNIVKDAEEIREALMLPLEPGEVRPCAAASRSFLDVPSRHFVRTLIISQEPGPRPWGGALGQSFGGFCMMSYLSLIDRPPKTCLLTGGIAPMLTPVYDAYSSLWDRVKERSLRYYEKYPGDIALVKKIVRKLLEQPAMLPSGGTLTARRFLQLGLGLGGSPTSFASLHSLLSSAFMQPDESEFTRAFLKKLDTEQSFDDHPVYYWLHESIYADGPSKNSPTSWAAHRAYESKAELQPEFDYRVTCKSDADDNPILFFGEMVFPWMSEDYAELSGVGAASLAHALASKSDWEPLYDQSHMKNVLGDGRSRAAAAVYYEDLYVDFECSMKVASRGGPLEKCKVFVTNDYQHCKYGVAWAWIFAFI